jgi:hypothetical protein
MSIRISYDAQSIKRQGRCVVGRAEESFRQMHEELSADWIQTWEKKVPASSMLESFRRKITLALPASHPYEDRMSVPIGKRARKDHGPAK